MRRIVLLCLVALVVPWPGSAQPGLPPHAWLFGTWTGGMFPVRGGVNVQACLSQPVVIFTRDLVMRATLTQQVLTQREVSTVRGVQGGVEFQFTGPAAPDSSLLGLGGSGALAGFGCETSDVLHVQRRGRTRSCFPVAWIFPIRWCVAVEGSVWLERRLLAGGWGGAHIPGHGSVSG